MDLIKYREVYDLYAFSVDAIGYEEVGKGLADVDRETLKRILSAMSPDFERIFREAPAFKTTKDENRYYVDMLGRLLNFTVSEVPEEVYLKLIQDEADTLYDECTRLNHNLNVLKSSSYSTYSDIQEQRGHLLFTAGIDAEQSLKSRFISYFEDGFSLYKTCKQYYEIKTETVRKSEQRNRNLLFIYMLMGLCYFYDLYHPPIYNKEVRYLYSIMDVLYLYNKYHGYNRFLPTVEGIWAFMEEYNTLNPYHHHPFDD